MANFRTQLADCQAEYDKLSINIEGEINLQGKKLEPALTSQPHMQRQWGLLNAKLAGLHEESKNITNTQYGVAFTLAQSNNYKDVNTTEAKWLAEQDTDYNNAKEIELKIYRLRKEVDVMCDVIESRKYILKDLTASIINQVNNARLD